MTTTIVSTNTIYTSDGYVPAASGDSYILLPNVVARSDNGFISNTTGTLTNLSFSFNGIAVSGYVSVLWADGSGARVSVGTTGHLYSEYSALANFAVVALFGNNSALSNAGEIVTASGSGFYGSGANTMVANSGLISGGYTGVDLRGANDTVTNTGIIQGTGPDSEGVNFQGGTGSLFNSGTITGGGNLAVGQLVSAGVAVQDLAAVRIVNEGTIATPSSYGIWTGATGSIDLTNLGVISGAVGVQAGGLADKIVNTGTIVGDVFLGAGDDLFDGIGGVVTGTVFGGDNNDVFRVSDPLARVFEYVGYGTQDRVESTVSFSLAGTGEVENLTLLGIATDGTGNEFNNIITGNFVDNRLGGGAGHDTVYGGAGDDTQRGDSGNDSVLGGDGDDSLRGGGGADTLYGGDGDDTIWGDAAGDRLYGDNGEDVLVGGAGRDTLYGGTDADTFVFRAVADSAVGAALRDIISGFEAGLDVIDLTRMDANTILTGNQAFTFIGTGAFTNVAGQLRAVNAASSILQADVNGDGVADFELQFNAIAALNGNDILL